MKAKGKLIISVLLGLIVIMCFLIIPPNGKVKNVQIIPVSSEIYSEDDINQAVEEIKKSFIRWKDCELLTLKHVGDAIVFYSSTVWWQTPAHVVIITAYDSTNKDFLYCGHNTDRYNWP